MPLAFPWARAQGARPAGPAYTARVTDPTHSPIVLSSAEWQAFLADLYERDDRLDRRVAGEPYTRKEAVDEYVMSAHAEALQSAEVEGDLWGTLEDIDETAADEQEAWDKIRDFYLGRGCVLVRVTGPDIHPDEPEEWIFAGALARRLGLLGE